MTSSARSGRPRDPALAERALDATLELYGERGWAGLTMDAVATRAKVGKAGLYLRWPTKADLLTEALTSAAPHIETEPGLAPRQLFLAIGRQMLDRYTGRYGPAIARLMLESAQLPEVLGPIEAQFVAELHGGVETLQRLADEGEVVLRVSPATMVEALAGTLLMRGLFTSRLDDDLLERDLDAFVEEVVDLVLGRR